MVRWLASLFMALYRSVHPYIDLLISLSTFSRLLASASIDSVHKWQARLVFFCTHVDWPNEPHL